MASGHFGVVLRHIRKLMGGGEAGELPDGLLLDRFLREHDQAAFAALVERHGPMVLGVCRRVLQDWHEADDAFQASFLVLVRRARHLDRRGSLASWLYTVAYHLALRARAQAARRRTVPLPLDETEERQAVDMKADHSHELGWRELRPVLDQELCGLPEKYRAPLVLCYLEGKSNEEAARHLRLPAGTVKSRLARGREMLRGRLTRRGVALPATVLGGLLAEQAAQAVPPALAESTVQAASLCAAGAVAGSVKAIALADGFVRSLVVSRLKFAASVLVSLCLLGGAALFAYSSLAESRPAATAGLDQPVALPQDPQSVVLAFDLRGGGQERDDEQPLVEIQADGSVRLGSLDGTARPIETRISAERLQELLRFAVRENDFYRIDLSRVQDAIRTAEVDRGLAPLNASDTVTVLRLKTAEGEKEIRYAALPAAVRRYPEVKALGQLLAIQRRLEQLATWIHAGLDAGVEEAVRRGNEKLREQFPEAPPFTADDLQMAVQRRDGRREIVLERRRVVGQDPFTFIYALLETPAQGGAPLVTVKANLLAAAAAAPAQVDRDKLYLEPINVEVPHISRDPSVKYDYDIVYVRTPRKGDRARSLWTEIAHPALMDAGGDLMLLHPDGSEELLVAGGADGSVTDPMVSFDGEWVYYSHIQGLKGTSQHGQPPFQGADIYKIHVKTRKIVRLTHQEFEPNTGAGTWSKDYRTPEKDRNWFNYGVLNMGPCPLPGGKIVFTSNRFGFVPPKHPSPTQQLFVMDEDGSNLECIGHLNIGMALHPVVLQDGRILFSSLESQGLRNSILWGLWSIHPDGTNWGPVLSAFDPGSAPNAFHFQTQLSDGSIIAEEYYNQNNSGFGAYLKLPPAAPGGYPPFGPGYMGDPRNPPLRFGRFDNGKGKYYRLPFSPFGVESFTRFALNGEGPADPSVRGQKDSPKVGKFTHPSGAPDNHLLTCYSPGPVNHQYTYLPMPDGGIYLIKSGQPIDEPAQMLLIKNDPNYNEQWPRAVVSYRRVHGIDEPKRLRPLANDGKLSRHLPEGTPFGLVGTSSLYKRESYPNGVVPPGSVTATYAGGQDPYRGLDPFNTSENGATLNWFNQGADAGIYSNDDIHAIRILAMEPTTDRDRGPKSGRLFYSHARERLRILGEIPVRKFSSPAAAGGAAANGDAQPLDPDGNPDTSFLAKIPANVAFTFQTLDKDGMVLNMAQTWHQLRPGEIRNDCGGCHAHSQKPTDFQLTAAARADYPVFDLTRQTPLLTTRARDESGRKWDAANQTGLRFEKSVKNVEFWRDVKPILDRSCVACHTQAAARDGKQAPGNLVLDDYQKMSISYVGNVPGTYYRLALDHEAKFGHKPIIHNGQWRNQQATRYVRMFQARRSLLIWKVHGRRTDGWSNDDFPSETVPGDANSLKWRGQPIANTPQNRNLADLDFVGSAMPPPEAVAGNYVGPDGRKIQVEPLTDEDRRTLVRWIDLGCPIDLDSDPALPSTASLGWMLDDNRPTLALTYPRPGANAELGRILVGMHDYYTGLDLASFQVVADFEVDGTPAGENLAGRFQDRGDGVWELRLARPITRLPSGKLTVSVRDRQGNTSRMVRTFSVGK